jgi:membrane fusion protein, multidrug efflux system
MSLRLQIIITTFLAVIVAGGWLWLEGDKAESSQDRSKRGGATRVLVEPLAFAEDRVVVRAVGTGDALKSAAIHPSVSGEVTDILFSADRPVKKGAVLVRLDDQHQRLAVRLTQVTLRKARRDLSRLKKLTASGHASRARLDTAQTELESAQIHYSQAKADLADRSVIAPFAGVIGLTEINIGDRVTDDTMIATLDDRSTILVDFDIPEDYAARLQLGDTVMVRPSTTPGKQIKGAIYAMASRIRATSRSLRVRARIPNPDDAIRPGTSFEVELAFIGKPYPRVREVAVMWSRDGAYLWRANAMKAEQIFVKLVRRDSGHILVDGPLQIGDLVVVEGVQGLRAGQKLDAKPFGLDDPAGASSGKKKRRKKKDAPR